MARSPIAASSKDGADIAEQPAGAGHNQEQSDEARFLRHVRAIVEAQAKVEEAKSFLRSARKLAKADGIELKQLDAVVTMADWEPGEVRDHFAIRNRYALWLGLPIGTQADLFANVPQAARESVDWEARGLAAALTNKGAFAGKPPEDCPPDRLQDWQRGVNRGVEKIAWSMSEAGHNPDRSRTDIGVSHVPLEPEPAEEDADRHEAEAA